jgi:hypothetical protein
LYLDTILPAKLTLKLTACVAYARKTVDDRRIKMFLKFFCVKEINELVVTSKKLRHNLEGLVTSSLGPNAARGP